MRLLLMAGMLALIGCRTPAPRTPERPGLFAAVSEHWGAQPVSRCVYRSGVALTEEQRALLEPYDGLLPIGGSRRSVTLRRPGALEVFVEGPTEQAREAFGRFDCEHSEEFCLRQRQGEGFLWVQSPWDGGNASESNAEVLRRCRELGEGRPKVLVAVVEAREDDVEVLAVSVRSGGLWLMEQGHAVSELRFGEPIASEVHPRLQVPPWEPSRTVHPLEEIGIASLIERIVQGLLPVVSSQAELSQMVLPWPWFLHWRPEEPARGAPPIVMAEIETYPTDDLMRLEVVSELAMGTLEDTSVAEGEPGRRQALVAAGQLVARAARAYPGYPRFLNMQVQLALAADDPDGAEAALAALLRQEPSEEVRWYRLAVAARRSERAVAEELLRQGMPSPAARHWARFVRGRFQSVFLRRDLETLGARTAEQIRAWAQASGRLHRTGGTALTSEALRVALSLMRPGAQWVRRGTSEGGAWLSEAESTWPLLEQPDRFEACDHLQGRVVVRSVGPGSVFEAQYRCEVDGLRLFASSWDGSWEDLDRLVLTPTLNRAHRLFPRPEVSFDVPAAQRRRAVTRSQGIEDLDCIEEEGLLNCAVPPDEVLCAEALFELWFGD